MPGGEVGREAARVRVQVGDQLAASHRQRPPHGVALAERRARAPASARPPGAPRRRGARPARRCRPRRRRPPRAPGPRAPGSASRLSTIGPIVSATSRVGSTTVTGSRLRSSSSSRGNSEWWWRPDQTARTMAVRVLRSHDLRLGAGAGEGARRGARSHRPRGRSARLAHARPGRSPPGSARVPRRDRLSLVAPGRHARGGSPRPHDRDHGHGQRQVARLQPPGARHARRAIPGRALSTCIRPRRSPRTRRAAWRASA